MSDSEFATQRYQRRANADEQMQWNKERIREAINDFDWTRSTADAFVALIWEDMQKSRGWKAGAPGPRWRLDKPETLYPFIKTANLPLKIEIQRALNAAWAATSYTRCAAFDGMVLDQFHTEGHLDVENAGTYLSIIESLGKNDGWPLKASAQEAAERERSIKNILGVA